KSRPEGRLRLEPLRLGLLDLRFLEDDVLARYRVVLLEFELLGLGARVLLGHVVEAGVGAGHHLDQDRGRLGHGSGPLGGRQLSHRPGPVKLPKTAYWRWIAACSSEPERTAWA